MSEGVYMDYAIKVNNLTKKFGIFTAVNGISFNIEKGRIFGFLGPNGSGKSTTIRMLCGVITPTSGTGEVMGYDIEKDTEKVKKTIGYMSQKFGLYDDLTVDENLSFYGGIYGLEKDEIIKREKTLIELSGLTGKEKRLAKFLSGGFKQRLALSCAIIHKPKLLILDEPTAGVDPVSRRVFWEIIHQLVKQDITVFVTTHYMDEAESCDIIGFIFNGKILAMDTPQNLIAKENASNLEDVFIKYVEEQTGEKVRYDFKF